MKLAFMTDVHANLVALEAALQDMNAQGVTRIARAAPREDTTNRLRQQSPVGAVVLKTIDSCTYGIGSLNIRHGLPILTKGVTQICGVDNGA